MNATVFPDFKLLNKSQKYKQMSLFLCLLNLYNVNILLKMLYKYNYNKTANQFLDLQFPPTPLHYHVCKRNVTPN